MRIARAPVGWPALRRGCHGEETLSKLRAAIGPLRTAAVRSQPAPRQRVLAHPRQEQVWTRARPVTPRYGMDAGMRDRRPRYHEFALELERARREAGLKSSELASKLFVHPRTVHRYLQGERLPTIQTTKAWEQVCNIEPGRLVAMYPAARPSAPSPLEEERLVGSVTEETVQGEAAEPAAGPGTRQRRGIAAAGVVIAVALAAMLLARGADNNGAREATAANPTGVAYHRFTGSYVGDVWIRITPAREQVGESHRVTLRWGAFERHVDLNLDGSQTLFTGKRRPDRQILQVDVRPAATIAFGEGNVPAAALDINRGWTQTG